MHRLNELLPSLEQALSNPPLAARAVESWRHVVSERLTLLEEVLTTEPPVATDPWLAARRDRLGRERERLRARLTVLTRLLAEQPDPEPARAGLLRLVEDVAHHRARATDFVYDDAGLDVGGSD